jgi:putative ABC transport system permease protein
MSPLNRKLVRDLRHLWGQMMAVMLVIACGIAAFVMMVSVYNSLLATRSSYYEAYRFADLFANARRVPEEVANRIHALGGVAAIETRVVAEVTLAVPRLAEPATGRIVSIPDVRRKILNDIHLRKGNWISSGADDQIIASEAFALANHLEVGDTLGAVLNGRWRRLLIVGIALSPEYVYEVGGSFVPDNKRFGVLWMGRRALSAAFDMKGAFNDVTLTLTHDASEKDVVDRIDQLLERYAGSGAYGRADQLSHHFLQDELVQLRANTLVMPAIFLGVAAFLLHIVLLRLVGTQRDQIAVLKAFGYDNRAVGLHYLMFALVVVLAGALLGTGIGMWFGNGMTELYAKFYRFPVLQYTASPEVIIYALLISGCAAVLGATGAVRRATKLPPAEAMRPEPPARFKPGPFERLGLGRIFSTSGRMVMRNLERNPSKAFISTFGISLSVAILVVGRFSFDAFDFMTDLVFNTAQRADVTVVLNHPSSAEARYQFLHLPGVIRAEPFRSVPVRLRNLHHTRKLAILGTEPGAELQRIVDGDFRIIPPPRDGILITKILGTILEVGPGDSVEVEVLEGRRRRLRMKIAGMVDEMFGISAYAQLSTIDRMLGEEGTISGVWVMIDESRSALLYERLKRTPAVAGVVVRRATLKSFQDTVAESQAMSATALVIFASIIAFGIVYNSARISLSERGRELVSLRVLGFTRREVALMLLGEQAIITLAAIPLGYLLGYLLTALVVALINGEMYRFPVIVSAGTFAYAAVVILVTAAISAILVRRRLDRLDMIEVLKTRE